MKYPCQTIDIKKITVGYDGFIEPLCNECKSMDCTNLIEYKKVSILGITKTMRVMVRGNNIYYVVDCKGYIKD